MLLKVRESKGQKQQSSIRKSHHHQKISSEPVFPSGKKADNHCQCPKCLTHAIRDWDRCNYCYQLQVFLFHPDSNTILPQTSTLLQYRSMIRARFRSGRRVAFRLTSRCQFKDLPNNANLEVFEKLPLIMPGSLGKTALVMSRP